MAANRTEKSAWQSKYGGGWCTFQQRVAEILCERLANKNKESLVDNFWQGTKSPKYKRHLLLQLQLINSLLKLYSADAILNAINKMTWIYSLGGEFLDPFIQQEEASLKNKEAAKQTEVAQPPLANTNSKPRPTFTKGKSKLSSLREL